MHKYYYIGNFFGTDSFYAPPYQKVHKTIRHKVYAVRCTNILWDGYFYALLYKKVAENLTVDIHSKIYAVRCTNTIIFFYSCRTSKVNKTISVANFIN